ncbi:hypothetical protein Smic_24870 [Streptomyces microflavus]|uniref:Protein kinase G tetratricopeptide repeat containing domain-containing protein n=1 Tax=Streptomyces microflavus TaxID=1919 RepID=A0A7J0CN61_STRMI|nr:hypothetical protein Smic_24870 [Streptomyces microflavus]
MPVAPGAVTSAVAGALPVGGQPSGPGAGAWPAAGAAPLTAAATHVRGGPQSGTGTGAYAGPQGGTGAGAYAGPQGGGPAAAYAPPAQAPVPAPRTASPAARTGPYGPFGATAGGVRLALFDARATALALPVPRVDANDPNAGFLAGLMASAPAELIAALQAVPAASLETRLRELRARLEMREPDSAAGALTDLEGRHPDDWRVVWYRGITSLVTGDHEVAALSFDAVYDAFPGEPAPKLALGICAEVLGQLDNAAEYYRLVWATDPSFVSAAFGLARVQIAAGDRAGAAHTLESVPEASIHYTAARVTAVRARLRERDPAEPLLADLTAAAVQVAALTGFGLDPVRREQLTTEVLGKALDWILSGSPGAPPPGGSAAAPPGTRKLLDAELDERGLRLGLERSYRMLARLAQRGDERIELVERANRFRPGRGCEDVREPPAARPGEVPRLRGAAGVRRPVLRCVRLRPVGRAGPPRRPADDGDHGAAGCPGGACRVADGPARACRTAPGGPARTRRARASRGGRPVARRIGDGQLRRARARAPGDGPARHGLGRQAVADDASGAPRRPGGGGSGRHGTRRRARRTPLQSRQLQQPRQLGRLRSGRARSPHGGAHPDARRQYEGLRGLPVRPGGPRRILRELRARPAPRARPHGAGARLGGRRQRPGPAPPP